jgi:hypothetical protein
MPCCDHCQDAESFFSRRTAKRDLRRYRRRGPQPISRRLLHLMRDESVRGRSLLDVGGGIGALQHELMKHGLDSALQVDASVAYLRLSAEEAVRRGHGERIAYRHGDFVELAPELPEADVVTLDRVVCCYPDMPALLRASASRARELLGLTYPRERRPTRLAMGLGNLYFRVRGSAFRTFVHSIEAMDGIIRGEGFERVGRERTLVWEAALYRRR